MLLYRSRGFTWVWGFLAVVGLAGAPVISFAAPAPTGNNTNGGKPAGGAPPVNGGGASGGKLNIPVAAAKPPAAPASKPDPVEAAVTQISTPGADPKPPAVVVGPLPLPVPQPDSAVIRTKAEDFNPESAGWHIVVEPNKERDVMRSVRERGLPGFGDGDWERYKLPPVAASFLVAMLGVVDIEEVTGPKGDHPEVELRQLQKLDRDLAYLSNIFGSPIEAEEASPRHYYLGVDEKIDSIANYLALTEAGVPRTGSLARDYAMLSSLSENKKPGFQNFFVPVGSKRVTRGAFVDTQVLTEVQTLQTIRAQHLSELMTAGFNAGSSKSGNSRVVEAMMASVAAFLTTDHHTFADAIDTVADYRDGSRRLPDLGLPQGDALRLSAKALRQVDDVGLWETNFLRFVQTIRQASYPQYRATIRAFQRTLNQMVTNLRRLGEHVTRDAQFLEMKRTVPELYTLLEGLFTLYPELLPQSIMKEIIFDVVNGAGIKTDKDLLDIFIQQTGPIFRNIIQTLSHRKEMGEFQAMFKRTQSKNRPVPFPVIQKIITADPNGYKFDSIDPTPCGVGKIFQCHVGYMSGRKVAIRVRKPGIEKLASDEYELLMKAADRLGRLIFSGEPDDRIRLMRMQRLIYAEYQAVLAEMDVVATVENQGIAREAFSGRRKSKLTGNVFELRVPEALPAVEGSMIMVMDFIEGGVALEDYAQKEAQVGADAVNILAEEYYEKLLFNLFTRLKDPKASKVVGFANSDPHGGNYMVQPSFHDATDGLVTPLNLLDWGAVIRLTEEQVRDLFILEFGSLLKLDHIIADKLWKLKKSSAKSFAEIQAEVRTCLHDLGTYKKWTSSDWIMHMQVNGFIDFPGGLTRLHRARLFLIGLYEQMGSNAAALDKVIDELGTKYEKEVTAITGEDYPMWSNPGIWFSAWWNNRSRVAIDKEVACAAQLMKAAERVGPLDSGTVGGRGRTGKR